MFRNFRLSSSEKTRGEYLRISLFTIILSILFFTGFDVNALSLSAPTYYFTEINDASASSGTASLVGWWGTSNYYYGYDYYLGNMSTLPIFYRADYTFNNSNLCSDQDMMISGYVSGINYYDNNPGLFSSVSYQLDIYNNNKKLSCTTEVQENGSRLFYSCSGKGGGSYSISLKQNTFNDTIYYVGVSKDVYVVCNPSSQDIINSGIQNTDIIVNNNNQNTQTIIDNIEDKFETCKPSKNLFNKNSDIVLKRSFSNDGTDLYLATSFIQTSYISVDSSTSYTFSTSYDLSTVENGRTVIMEYDSSKNFIRRSLAALSGTLTITTTSNTKYVRLGGSIVGLDTYQFEKGSSATSYQPYGEVCSNKIDETNDKLDNIDSTLTDSNVDDETGKSFFDNFTLNDNGGISSIVSMPLRLINGLVTGSSSCQDLSFSVFEKEVAFPSGCILWSNAEDSIVILYQTIICGVFGYILLIRLFKDIEALKNPNDSGVSTLDL